MKPPRRGRRLSGDEARLWGEVAKLITPLRGRAVPANAKLPQTSDATDQGKSSVPAPMGERDRAKAQASPDKTHPALQPSSARERGQATLTEPPAPKRRVKLGDLSPAGPTKPVPPPFKPTPAPPGLERRERRGLQRGTLPIEARIDLHGLYQAEAHAALIGFLMRARTSGFARVLVVTGKGEAGNTILSERGILRRSVPHWLRGPDLRGVVLGFEEAGRQHGGAGALYVRLRRR